MELGFPDEKDEYSYTDDNTDFTEKWHYNKLGLSLSFDEEDNWRLGCITVFSSDFLFKNFIPVGLSKNDLIEKLREIGIGDLEYEDYSFLESPSHELLFSDLLGMNSWFD